MDRYPDTHTNKVLQLVSKLVVHSSIIYYTTNVNDVKLKTEMFSTGIELETAKLLCKAPLLVSIWRVSQLILVYMNEIFRIVKLNSQKTCFLNNIVLWSNV